MMKELTKEQKYQKRMEMPVLGKGVFHIGRFAFPLTIVKIGKRDIIGRDDKDGCLVTLSKQYVDITQRTQGGAR